MKQLFANVGCDKAKLIDEATNFDFTVEIVKRIDTDPGFRALPKR